MSTVVEIDTPQQSFTNDIHMPENRSVKLDALLESVGTFVFVYISLAGVNQAVLSAAKSQLEVAICFALGLSAGVLVAGKSGGHLNPAVSFTVYMTSSDFTLSRLVAYIAAQCFGGFCAGLLILAVYYSWIEDLPEPNIVIGAYGTLKNVNNSLFASILDQFIGSAFLMFGISMTPNSWSKPMTVGAILGGLALFQGTNGFAFNLARDFGPRVASAIVFGSEPFASLDYWFWVPMVVPFFGVPFGWCLASLMKSIA